MATSKAKAGKRKAPAPRKAAPKRGKPRASRPTTQVTIIEPPTLRQEVKSAQMVRHNPYALAKPQHGYPMQRRRSGLPAKLAVVAAVAVVAVGLETLAADVVPPWLVGLGTAIAAGASFALGAPQVGLGLAGAASMTLIRAGMDYADTMRAQVAPAPAADQAA